MTTETVVTAAPAVFTAEQLPSAPRWVEVNEYSTFSLDQTNSDGSARIEHSASPRQFVIVLNGAVSATSKSGRVTLNRRDWIAVPDDGLDLTVIRNADVFQAELLTVAGTWTDVNVCTIFQYRADRDLEMHFHDYNEYWFIYRGEFAGAFADATHQFRPGEMLAIPAGVEHGTREQLTGVIEGVGFSTTRIAGRRNGHLHRGADGEPSVLIDDNGNLLEGASK